MLQILYTKKRFDEIVLQNYVCAEGYANELKKNTALMNCVSYLPPYINAVELCIIIFIIFFHPSMSK